MKTLCVVPARGGSKGIPRKNLRFLLNKPLIYYVIETAKKSRLINYIVVSTDNEIISSIAKTYGVHIVRRPKKLAEDHVTLDPVVYHAVKTVERRNRIKFDIVVTLQPTAPLIKPETIDGAIEKLVQDDLDTVIPIVDDTHIHYIKEKEEIISLQKERANRQFLKPVYEESGAFLISKRNVITLTSRFGAKLGFVILSKEEGLDIDDYYDWWVAENLLKRMKIAIVTDGDLKIGLCHVYRMVSLADAFLGHEVIFFISESKKLGLQKTKEHMYRIKTYSSSEELLDLIEKYNPDVVINDILDTKTDYILKLKEKGFVVVNFEDLGEGARYADLVINALYENSNPPPNHYYGYRYVILRDEFRIWPPAKKIRKKVSRILLTFGGVDQNNLTLRTLKAIELLNMKTIKYSIILGLGYKYLEELLEYIEQLKEQGFKISLYRDVRLMVRHMYDADIIITSNGRTVYEAASTATSCISISQNEREMLHLFSRINYGVTNLGLASNVSVNDIAEALKKLIYNYEERKKMHQTLIRYARDLRSGIFRVKNIIEKYCYKEGS